MTKEAVVIYILYSNLTRPKEVLLLKKEPKEKSPKFMNDKLIGLGGFVETKKDGKEFPQRIFNATKRELIEEINLYLDENHTIVFSGKAYMKNQDLNVYFLKLALPYKIRKTSAKKEGPIRYFPIDFHKENPDLFMEHDLELLDMMYEDVNFDRIVIKT